MLRIAFLFAALGILIAVTIVLVIVHERKRREAFQREAQRLGLQYERQSAEQLPERLGHLELFRQGFARRVSHVLRGTHEGVEVRLFDYVYKTMHKTGRQNSQTHRFAVALAFLPQPMVKTSIVPENLAHKMWDAMGGDDIDFESHEFSRRFWVKSDDRRFAYDLIHPRMMEFLLTPGWTRWEIHTPCVALWEKGRVAPQHAQLVLDRLATFVRLMPTHAARHPLAAGMRA